MELSLLKKDIFQSLHSKIVDDNNILHQVRENQKKKSKLRKQRVDLIKET